MKDLLLYTLSTIGGVGVIIVGTSSWIGNLISSKILEQENFNNNKILEELKFLKQDKEDLLFRKREVYQKLITSMRVFLKGNDNSSESKNKFMEAYDLCFLWAPDNILFLLKKFLEMNIKAQSELDFTTYGNLYKELIIQLRKDAGFSDTILKKEDYTPVYM